jgi:hypothetical protein
VLFILCRCYYLFVKNNGYKNPSILAKARIHPNTHHPFRRMAEAEAEVLCAANVPESIYNFKDKWYLSLIGFAGYAPSLTGNVFFYKLVISSLPYHFCFDKDNMP